MSRLFREKSMGDAERGQSQVWCFECDPGAPKGADELAWDHLKGTGALVELLSWNDGADRDGVVFTVDTVDVPKLKRAMPEIRKAIKAIKAMKKVGKLVEET